MITVLQRQHVRKRASTPVRLKTHAPREVHAISRPSSHWQDGMVLPARFVKTRTPLSEAHRQRIPAAHRGRLILLFLVVALIAAAALVMLLVPGIRTAAMPLDRPLLPSPPETDQDVYRMLVPEEQPRAGGAPAVALPSTLKVTRYTAQAGESISRIAQRFKLNLDTIISWNDIRDARAVHAGMSLAIPNSDGLKYTVRRGDTLEQIARSNGLPLNAVLDWNSLPSSAISSGQVLFLPGVHMRTNDLNKVLGNLFIYPVRGKFSSYFGLRPDPFTGVRRFHNGVDIVNAPGTPIMAAMAGTVEDVGFNNNYGYYVILRHSGYQTLYGHLTRYVVSRGQKVQQGQRIGELGTTGYSTGPHLHFSIFKNGEAVDPLPFLK